MNTDTIAEVGIDEEGRLYVRPSTHAFQQIWRAAMEVNWDESERRLFGPRPREWSYVDWFRQIVAAPADEYGTRLSLTPETAWTNVPASLRAEIEALPQS
ncbi:hypothetical protein [Sphingosinicella terrae]|uniref:hypothetical protein n=1 Tax=Sphingosinicella terrae TaxID=2172047 RepID=UPI0013B3E824|nr:hypothetical protein [Sphingosinicella terrae]